MDAPYIMNSTNWLGIRTLYYREVRRFTKVWNQTLMAPVVTTLVWLAILTLALGGRRGGGVEAIPFNEFVAPGLIMMTVMQNAFANTSSSLMLSKIQGVIVDLLMPPFTANEMTFCLMAGGVTRGVCVGLMTGIAIAFFVPLEFTHPFHAAFYLVMSAMTLALLGMIGGIWAQGFDQMNSLNSYLITPLSFLSGTFYSVSILPGMWETLSHYNPFFYMIDGLRYGLTGYHDGSISTGIMLLIVLNSLLWLTARQMIKTGWRLRT